MSKIINVRYNNLPVSFGRSFIPVNNKLENILIFELDFEYVPVPSFLAHFNYKKPGYYFYNIPTNTVVDFVENIDFSVYTIEVGDGMSEEEFKNIELLMLILTETSSDLVALDIQEKRIKVTYKDKEEIISPIMHNYYYY